MGKLFFIFMLKYFFLKKLEVEFFLDDVFYFDIMVLYFKVFFFIDYDLVLKI